MSGTGVETFMATADAADPDQLRTGLTGFVDAFGVPEVLVYNAALIQPDAVGDISGERHLEAWSVNVVGAITGRAAQVLPLDGGTGHPERSAGQAGCRRRHRST